MNLKLLAIILTTLVVSAKCIEEKKVSGESKESESSEDSAATGAEKKTEKRGLVHSYGDFGGGGGGGGGGSDGGGGGSYDHHEHVKTVTVVKKVPVPYEVTKHVPYLV
ncbi:hypothetical protein M0802_016312, partial [Mischocyttarus mexicanus]